jgi:hypothetical protein
MGGGIRRAEWAWSFHGKWGHDWGIKAKARFPKSGREAVDAWISGVHFFETVLFNMDHSLLSARTAAECGYGTALRTGRKPML